MEPHTLEVLAAATGAAVVTAAGAGAAATAADQDDDYENDPDARVVSAKKVISAHKLILHSAAARRPIV